MPRLRPHHFLFVALFALYASLGLTGFGTDNDTYGMLLRGVDFLQGKGYAPSRSPGYPLPEIAVGLAALAGGHALSNALSATLGAVGVLCFYRLLREPFGRATALWAAAAAGLNPWWIVAASSSMDYVYAQAFALMGLLALRRGRLGVAALCLAACAASRLTYFPLGLIAYAVALRAPPEGCARKGLLASAAVFAALVFAVYLGVYAAAGPDMFRVHAGKRVGFFTLDGFATAGEYLGRYLYKNVFLWGLPALAGVIAAAAFARPRPGDGAGRPSLPGPVLWGLVAGAAYCQLVFLRLPIEIPYLLPFLFIGVCLLGLARRARFFLAWVTAGHVAFGLVAPTFVQVRYERDSFRGRKASGVEFAPGVAPGVVLNDIRRREAAEAFFYERSELWEIRGKD